MNSATPQSDFAKRLLWPAIAFGALLAWTAYCHLTWLHHGPHLHAVPAFFLGVLTLLLLNAAVRLCAGAWRNGWRWLFSRTPWPLCGWTLVFMVTTVVLFYTVELWRGKRAWAAVTREARARGESLDYETLLTPPPQDDQNFAKAPLFAPFFEQPHTNRPTSPQLVELERFSVRSWQGGAPFAPWLDGRESDLQQSRELHFRTNQSTDFPASTNRQITPDKSQAAAAMLAALEPYNATIESLRLFSSRPACWFPLNQPLPNRGSRSGPVMNQLIRLVRLRASAELAANRPEAAFEDVTFVLRLADYGRQRPQSGSLAHVPNHFAVVDAIQPIWEGLSERAWSAPQVAELQRQLGGLDFLKDFDDAVRADALTMAAFVERLIPTTTPRPARELFAGADEQRALDLVRLVYPVGWSLQDQAAIHRLHLEHSSRSPDVTARRLAPLPGGVDRVLFSPSDPFFPVFMTPMLVAMYADARESFPFAQTVVDFATVACSLERYRLVNGEFPATLDSLVPQFMTQLPHDIITGEPLKYRRTAGAGFVLYSVGFNQTDDGGQPCKRERRWDGLLYPMPDLDKDDWVWHCPAVVKDGTETFSGPSRFP